VGADSGVRTEEIAELLRAVRDRVRARYADASAAGVPLADVTPILHARDAALAKVAAIGSVNPRRPGVVNDLIQSVKRGVARALDWHVRDQVEFNRGVIAALEAVVEVLNDNNRALAAVAAQSAAAKQSAAEASQISADAVSHWAEWRAGWEKRLDGIEIEFLRGIADLHTTFEHRVAVNEERFRDQVKSQHSDFTNALDRAARDMQRDAERLIHSELRVVRQRFCGAASQPAAGTQPAPVLDPVAHQERFRGPEDEVRERQRFYVPFFAGCRRVLDLGCGRGEFLEVMREAGTGARGIDLNPEDVASCHAKGLDAEVADLFAYLGALEDGSLDGVFSSHVIEHLPPLRLPEMIRLAADKLTPGGRLAIETPNPECLAIFASHFYLDPTHERPVPRQLLAFYLQEAGMGEIRTEPRSPAVEMMPSLGELPAAFRAEFFGGLDYSIFATKL
jgi:O-antigen chain-terminating methyltransferase